MLTSNREHVIFDIKLKCTDLGTRRKRRLLYVESDVGGGLQRHQTGARPEKHETAILLQKE